MSIVAFPRRTPQREAVDLTARAQAEITRIERWRGRSIELLAKHDADIRNMSAIRAIADELIQAVIDGDGEG